jgi:hemerythrin
MLIQWSEKYSTGVDAIDDQHKEIINQLNRLHESITSGLGKEVIMDILEFTSVYASKHFTFEENCMNQYRCPVAIQNKEAHREFVIRFQQIRDEISANPIEPEMVLEVYRELKDWISSHILKIDTHLRSCVEQRG